MRPRPAMRAGEVGILPLPDRVFEGLPHGLLACFLDLLLHLLYSCACFDFYDERYDYLHERFL